jgi:hypothetical protein
MLRHLEGVGLSSKIGYGEQSFQRILVSNVVRYKHGVDMWAIHGGGVDATCDSGVCICGCNLLLLDSNVAGALAL